jgi:hypothetical protein
MTSLRVSAGGARLVAWSVLALFCALQWTGQVRPVAGLAAIFAVLGGAVIAVALLAVRRRGGRRAARLALPGAALGVLLLGALCSGIELRLLVPDRWGELATGVGQGLESLPDVRIPYAGTDEWVRAVIVLGGALIVGASAVAAFAGRGESVRAPVVSAALLGVLYAVPVVEEPPGSPFLSGAVLAVLLVAFLWAGCASVRCGSPGPWQARASSSRSPSRRRSTAPSRSSTTSRSSPTTSSPGRARSSTGPTTTGRSSGRATDARC